MPLSIRALLGAAALLTGCSGGTTSSIPGLNPPQPTPVFDLDPTWGGAGDEIVFRATGLDPDPANLEVVFLDFSGTIELRAAITSVVQSGSQQGLGPIRLVTAVVPGGIRSGSVTIFSDGLPMGTRGFDAAPEVVGVAVGNAGELGAVSRDPTGTVFPDEILLYGYNLFPGVTQVEVDDGTAVFTGLAFFPGAPPGSGITVPPGLEMMRVDLPNGLSPFTCETVALTFTCGTFIQPGVILESAPITVPFGSIPLAGSPGDVDIPGYFSGARVPPGTRLGDIPVDYAFLMDPAAARFDVVVEYRDPADPSAWLPCTRATGIGDILPGTREELPGGGLIGRGAPHRFVWDSRADISAADGAVGTRIRLRAVDPVPTTAVPCPTGEWISPALVIDNSARTTGSIVEEFEDTDFLDPTGGNAIWSFGELAAPPSGGNPAPQWGSGTLDIALVDGGSYRIDTDLRTITDITIPASPVELLTTNPGAPLGELHLRTLTIGAAASVAVVGNAPLVVRCAGTGSDAVLALSLHGDLILDAAPGSAATATAPGAGGSGGPGGGDGGDGGSIEVDGGGTAITVFTPATAGAPAGGQAGHGTTYALDGGVISLPRAGCGGGGGGSVAGGDGTIGFDPTQNAIATSGAGGPPRADDGLTLPAGGAGGGGGGACAIRLTAVAGLQTKHGGGGGGGGGAVEFGVRGRAELHGRISVRGGAGAIGSTGTQAGAGGGGSGGTIAVRATGNLELFASAELDAAGGAGAIVAAGPTPHRAGDGAAGRIRLESNLLLILPTPVPPTLTTGVATSGAFLAAGRATARARSRPYGMITDGGIAAGLPPAFDPAVITPGAGTSPTTTHVIALYEGAAAGEDPFEPGEFSSPVGDPTLIEDAEFIRVRWFLYSAPGSVAAVERWDLPFTHP